ncbi:hypothetical protein KSP40_PGU012839 [Platanthera guangdongensis]|uniref:AtPDCT1/2 transmembrane domain-containing protein n=1 Tax=Platanthera guangdongensis TaxID=2320717 RepID=A0ABR2LGA8_9ASPA
MVPPSSPPNDMGFLLTQNLHALLRTNPALNSFLAASNTVFVVMQAAYIVRALLVEGRPRPTIAALFMFTCRASPSLLNLISMISQCNAMQTCSRNSWGRVDFPPGNMSFLFFSGHIAGAIASRDMRRMRRHKLASAFDYLNALQALRLLAARGHYTIDLAVGIAAGFFFDILAGKYHERNNVSSAPSDLNQKVVCSSCNCR